MSVLNACPFCGDYAFLVESGGSTAVHCFGCSVQTQYKNTRDDAISLWNRRSPPKRQTENKKSVSPPTSDVPNGLQEWWDGPK